MELNIPRNYLSHTQIETWRKSKKEYRARYYDGKPMYQTPELEFGKRVAEQYEALHKDPDAPVEHPVIKRIPRGDVPEYELKCEVRGVPIVGYIDSFDTNMQRVHEVKTGKTPWSQARVDRHPQLKMYCAAMRSLTGSYNPYVYLHWIETRNTTGGTMIDGMSFGKRVIELTGELATLHTVVTHNDLLEYEKVVEQTAREISEDFTLWKRLKNIP